MSETPYIVEITRENFNEVVQASNDVPIVLDFWATWCEPCKVLLPLLTRLAGEYQGGFILAKVNIDEQQELAAHFGIRSVPTVKIVYQGQFVDEFSGAIPESEIRAILERYVSSPENDLIAEAETLAAGGQTEQAKALLQQAMLDDPENTDVRVAMARLLMGMEDYDAAGAVLRSLPKEKQEEPDAAAMLASLTFVEAIAGTPAMAELEAALQADPTASEVRYQLAMRRIVAGDLEAGMELLLELMRRDRTYGEDAARKALIQVFDMLGGSGELVNRYRGRMFAMLY